MKKVMVIGTGLAGSWMAYELHRRGLLVCTVDDGAPETSSRVAAGLINPVNGSRPIAGWKSDVILPYVWSAYADLEQATGRHIWTDRRIRRTFLTEKDVQLWQNAIDRGLVVDHSPLDNVFSDGIRSDYGGVEYAGATIDTNVLIDAVAGYVEQTPMTMEEADLVIWCTGWRASQHPLWSWLPFQPVKGEIVDAEIEGPLDAVYLRGVWIIPSLVSQQRAASSESPQTMDDRRRTTDDRRRTTDDRRRTTDDRRRTTIRIGSTHDWDDLTITPTEQAKIKLVEKAREILGREIFVTGQRAAVRPAAQSKRPYIGLHPEQPKHAIVNGLGAKGSMWAPWAAHHLASHVWDGGELDPEVNTKRWWKP